jgi:hypothetical protein
MVSIDDLVNKGFILNQLSDVPGRTFIVTGLYRSGTSLVASILQQAGLFMGNEIGDSVYQDEEIFPVLAAGDMAALRRIVVARNADHSRWGFKYPMLWRAFDAGELARFDNPRLIVTFRDPVSIAVRTSLSEYQEPMRALRDAAVDLSALMAFIGKLDCPNLLLSYEKALVFPLDFVDAILQFCDIPRSGEMRARLLALIQPNRPRYLGTARRRVEGLIEGVRDGLLYGWCCLTRSAEPVTLEVLVDDRVALTMVADTFRQDLLDAQIGEGSHGFFVPLRVLQARPQSVIRVRVAGHGVELENSGKRVRDFGAVA